MLSPLCHHHPACCPSACLAGCEFAGHADADADADADAARIGRPTVVVIPPVTYPCSSPRRYPAADDA